MQKFWDSDNLANRKGGFMKKIILWITIFALLLTTKTVSAATQDTFYEGSYIPNAYIKKLHNGRGTYKQMKFIIRQRDGMFAYCIEPWETLSSYDPYDESYNIHDLSDEVLEHINKIAYYGYGYQNHTDSIWYAVTQLMIWRYVEPGDEFYFTGTLNGTKTTKYDAMFQELENLVQQSSPLSFQPSSISFLLGTTGNISVVGDLNNYQIQASDGLSFTVQGQTISLHSSVPGTYQLQFVEKENNRSNIPLVYRDANSQSLLVVGSKRANQYTIPVTIYTGSIELIKQDSVSASISSGDASLAGAKFLIQKEDGTFSETVTIPESLSVSISGLGAGTYTIREVKAGEGYQLNKKIETIVLDANNYQIHIPFYNDVIEKKITIYKTYGTSKQLWPEENAVFEIYHSEELIATIQTDENGYGSINLPYGTYRIKQIQGKDGYDFVPEFTVSVTEDDEELFYPLTDYLKTGTLQIYKRDWDSQELIVSDGFQFLVTNLETNEKYTVFTKDGIATLSELLPGRYSIQEVTSESGYQIEEQAFFFEITDVDLEEANFIYSFDIYNKKVNVPNTGIDAFSSTIFGILLVAIGNIVLCKRKLGF